VLLLHGLGSLGPDLRERVRGWVPALLRRGLDRAFDLADARRSGIVVANLVTGVALGAYTGLLLGTMAARQQWSTAVLGPLFLTSGISTGAAFLLLFRLDGREQHLLVRWDIAAIVGELLIIALMLIGLLTTCAPGQAAALNLLGGSWTPCFWALVVFTGLLVPLLLNVLEVRGQRAATLFSPLLVLYGGLMLRFVLVAAGQDSSCPIAP